MGRDIIKDLPLYKIKPYDKNYLSHDKNIEHIKNSIRDFGFNKASIVIDENNILLAGHGTLRALQDLKYDKIPYVVQVTDLSEKQKSAYRIADNSSGSKAEVLDENLKHEFDLIGSDFNLDDYGFDYDFEEDLAPDDNEDTVPEVQEEPKTKLGDLIELGNHRLLCGDSTVKESVDYLMNGAKADMVLTDPPYNIGYEGGSKKREKIANDKLDDFNGFMDKFYKLYFDYSKDGAAIYVWHASTETHNFINCFVNAGFLFKSYIVWNKNNSTFGRSDYHWKHEPCIYGWKGTGSHKWHGDRKQTTVWDIDRPSRSDAHPTMKPIDLCERSLINSSKKKDIIFDLFLGSGSTLIACEKTNRKCYGMELDPHYCDVIIKRWCDYTGNTTFKRNGVEESI